jgi:hypothetical protein
MIERANPAVANIETADGGPAGPMRIRNLPRFAPLFLHEGKKLVWVLGNRMFGLHLWDKSRSTAGDYPSARWRVETMKALENNGVLVPGDMVSAELFDREALARFLSEAREEGFRHEGLLSRVVTVELAMRELGASL